MKISFMTFICPEWTLEQILKAAQQYGYDGVEPRVADNHRHGIEPEMGAADRRQVRQMFAEAGLEIACVATSCTFATNDPAQRAANLDSLKRHLDLAADLGAPGIRVFGGVRPAGMSLGEAIAVVAEDLAQGGEWAGERGVEIWLETHDDFSLGQTVAAVLQQASAPALKVNWDLMHPFIHGESPEETWSYLQGGKVKHTHLHDGFKPNGGIQLCPIGAGIIPFHEPLRRLKAEGYAGYLSAEYWTELGPPEEALPAYVASVRRLLEEL